MVEKPIEFIEIQVSGSGFELLGEQMSLNRNALDVNLQQARRLGKNRFGIATSNLQNEVYKYLDKDIRFERITFDSIIFITDQRVVRKLKVIPDLDISFESSYNLMGEVSVQPPYVEVSGPKGYLDSLELITTKKLKEEDVNDSLQLTYDFGSDGRFSNVNIVPEKVSLLVPVDKFTEKTFEVPITWSGNFSIRTFPNKVKVIFLVPLSNYEQLTEREIIAKVDLDSDLKEKKKLKVAIKGVPHFAKLLRIEPEKVEFIIKQ